MARFRTTSRLSYCLHDPLIPRHASTADVVVVLDGSPPFSVAVSIKSLSSSEVETRTVEVVDKVWKLDLPSYSFQSIGPHLIKILSVQDASRCAPAPPDPLAQSLWVDVAETATIVPLDRREDFCVGQVSQFQLEGMPPWTVGFVGAFFICLTLTSCFVDIVSTANRTHKKQKPHDSLCSSNSPGSSRSHTSHINKRCARLL